MAEVNFQAASKARPDTASTKPTALEPCFGNIPNELRALPNWIMWRYEPPARPDNPKWRKVPCRIDGKRTDAANRTPYWTTFDACRAAYRRGMAGAGPQFDGIGFCFDGEIGPDGFCYTGIDFDNCCDGNVIELRQRSWIMRLNTYWEQSPSGHGVHCICRSRPYTLKTGNVEIYSRGRYFTFTGHGTENIRAADDELQALIAEVRAEQTGRESFEQPSGGQQAPAAGMAAAFAGLDPSQSLGQGIENNYWYDRLQPEQKDEVVDYALEVIASKTPFLEIGGNNDRWYRLTTSVARSGAPNAEDIFVKHASAAGDADPEDALREKFTYCQKNPRGITVGTLLGLALEHGADFEPWRGERHTDLGNARRIVRIHGDNIRYVAAWKSWLVWRDGHWRRDDDGEIMRLAKATVEGMFAEAATVADEAVRNAQRKYALRCQSAQRLAAMVELAKTERAVILPVSMIDTDPMLLGVENGVVDLRTGGFRPAKREDYVTKRCGVAFDPSAECPNWEAFLQQIFPDDRMIVAYVQRACGYTLTGLTDEEVMFILWGIGANGKSTLRETLFALMGDYAMGADASLLIAHKKQQGGATPDVARMFGKRLVTVNETQEGDHLNESRVKFITSHDITTARFLYENPFDFTPTHKTMLTTNKKPIIKGTDPGIWRRVQMWPFLLTIPKDERDRYFRQKNLMPEISGILNWALAGLMSYREQGLAPPPAVIEATEEYRKDMDVIGQWITARFVPDPESRLKRTDLFRDYELWSKANIGWHMTSIAFGRELAGRKETLGLTETWIDRERGWRGVALCSPTATLWG